jgi:hypothetical protein
MIAIAAAQQATAGARDGVRSAPEDAVSDHDVAIAIKTSPV